MEVYPDGGIYRRTRTGLRHLIGEVLLRPGKDAFLVAKLSGSYAGRMKLAGVEIEPHYVVPRTRFYHCLHPSGWF